MAINVNSEAFCRKAYLNYHCYGNSMGLTNEDMSKITSAWPDRISSWQATVSDDENEYDFDDSEYANYKEKGKEAAKEATGHDGSTDKGRVITDAAGSAVTTTVASGALNGVANGVYNSISSSVENGWSKLLSQKTKDKAAQKLSTGKEDSAKKDSKAWIITAPLALAIGTAYMAKKPNKDEKEACDALQTEMAGAQATLSDTQGEMETMSEEIITLSDEATMVNEDTNEEIEEQKTEYDMFYETMLAIKAKIDAGEPLTESEKELYKEVVGLLTETGVNIEELSEDTTEEVTELYDEMGTYQEGYDVAAETMGEVEGLTDFAEGFDEATRTLCYVEAFSQTLNVASGGKAAFDAGKYAASGGPLTAWAWGWVAMGAAGAAMSGVAAAQQFKWAGEVGTEIEMREVTQDVNTDTNDIYTEEIDAYDGYMEGVEELELEIPDDIEAPEDVPELPTDEPTGKDAVPEELKPKKPEKES